MKGAKGDDEAAKARRARFIPLPSVGMAHTDRSIRRLLIELPSDCPLKPVEFGAKLSGASLDTVDPETGEVLADGPRLIEAADVTTDMMLHYYGIGDSHGYRRWRSVTPLALPAKRRRIDPDRQSEKAKGGSERLAETAAAISAAKAALRHAGRERAQVVAAHPQKEPFAGKGRRAEDFERPERFSKHQMWHLDLTLREPITGPLILGDGRFAGLGLMAPVGEPPAILAFALDDQPGELASLCLALRRAVMHRLAEHLDKRSTHQLDAFFTGHEPEGAPARRGDHRHLFFAMDDVRLLIISPHLVEHRPACKCERQRLGELDAALIGLDHLRIGRRTRRLTPLPEPGDDDPLLRPARRWKSRTAYTPARHPKRGEDARAHLARDIRVEASRRGLPRPDKVEILSLEKGPRGGLTTRIALDFAVAIPGPILLGRTAHRGGGLFKATALTSDG
ncbi:MAG: type I-U CRISPR-associated protein Csb2 [Caulobacterales bacterium]|nr:type I-U CRISPR-associated protein Csb2 [Caulobacterales bacterium]